METVGINPNNFKLHPNTIPPGGEYKTAGSFPQNRFKIKTKFVYQNAPAVFPLVTTFVLPPLEPRTAATTARMEESLSAAATSATLT